MTGILDFLMPREKKFIEMLMVHSDILHDGAQEFHRLILDFNNLSEAEILERRATIKSIEHRGDNMKREISDGLHETFITPLDREDILSLTQNMDYILDYIHEAATKIAVYKAKNLPGDMIEFSGMLLKCCTTVNGSMHNLKNYVEIKKAIMSLQDTEMEADKLFFRCIGEIFEKNHDAKDIIKFKEIYESMEEAVNMCEKVGDILGKIVIKHG